MWINDLGASQPSPGSVITLRITAHSQSSCFRLQHIPPLLTQPERMLLHCVFPRHNFPLYMVSPLLLSNQLFSSRLNKWEQMSKTSLCSFFALRHSEKVLCRVRSSLRGDSRIVCECNPRAFHRSASNFCHNP